MTNIPYTSLIELAIDLSSGLINEDRFERLLTTVRKTISCDAVVLLARQGEQLKPLALQGLSSETLGRRFEINEHPRFQKIAQSTTPVRFESNSPLPDPYDGLLLAMEGDLPVHSCMGFPLLFEDSLIGLLTLDSLTPNSFDDIPQRTLDVISAMSAATLKTALTLDLLEQHASHSRQLVAELTHEALIKDGGEIIGNSPAMNKLKKEIQIVAQSNFTALISGETGVGKELVARTLHQQSSRSEGPLVYVNCAALPENLIESELFGHRRGAFTGANENRSGKFTIADGGTLFLDEIGEIPLAVQSKLLRALQSQEIQAVGQDKTHTVDVRIIAATNRNLVKEVEAGHFRSDLFHRLTAYPIHVPALRERGNDTALLAGYFIEQIRRRLGIQQIKFAPEVTQYLKHYDWPGNVRELEHTINRAALKANNSPLLSALEKGLVTIELSHIGQLVGNSESDSGPEQTTVAPLSPIEPNLIFSASEIGIKSATEEFQRQLISNALNQHQGNWSAAARQLKTDRANLSRMAKRLGINIIKTVQH
ncbi:MAG: nitric oxide reductase transcriptional regulator NorR [Oleispira antarctica]|uniref:Anaerobic nitric oxide reductase transcription regulator n=1 Tax=Oleispira antarctica RB-8 TaxID=698738 RepID=R4YQU6_OLEAN|nr:nitric oxide reductase transcriptional regulator NorR [Oleispira antarctica]MBQ0791566.1 nitric oxide reductase transcriptional regulator NorR [Oleispira antarctica]CCK77330.1 Anaerobic nitric oxide reductase transcription regulator [Oleispira antarctica RB-8]|tara:strand:- start:2519 stop:4132 length:1614 start_codon:yes stop_codon:yes gene_type:complete